MRTTGSGLLRRRGFVLAFAAALVLSQFPSSLLAAVPSATPTSAPTRPAGDPNGDPIFTPGTRPLDSGDDPVEELLKRDDAFITRRTAGDVPLSVASAGKAEDLAHKAAKSLKKSQAPISPPTFTGAWTEISPNPIVQQTRGSFSFYAVSGRVSALAIRPSNGQKILGGAQGGIWTYDEATKAWTARTDDQATLSIGSIAIAPSNDSIVYAGTGEGNLSGDSYFGHGFLKSTDGGIHWAPVGGDTFTGVSISKVVVDQNDPNRLWAAVIRGRAGSRRQTPPDTSKYGIWESKDGGATWKLLKKAKDELHGATDLVQDPGSPNILYATFWGDAIYQSTNYGKQWQTFMNGIPADATFGTGGGTRFAIGISHPAGRSAVLYAGFEWTNGAGQDQPSQVWKSVNGGAWALLPSGTGSVDNVSGYCGGQCFYDNLIGVDPNDPNTVYVLGLFNYGTGSGGVFRSTDGGQTWKDLGFDLHPDYHAIAINPAHTSQVMIGNDGGVWFSPDQGGRLGAGDPVDSVDWQDLNGTVDPNTAGVTQRTGLAITQFTSIANVPTLPARVWGGTQDNGTLRKSTASATWFDVEGGDGGQVLVDPTDLNFVYGNYFGISPYRNTDGGNFFTNSFITGGIDLTDRSEFYVPEVMNQENPDQLFLGTYRLYRTDNAKTDNATDVHWDAISPDLTSGCTGGAPNGARGCLLSAIGVSGGGDGVYTGSLEGIVYFSPDAVSSDSPTWNRVGKNHFPNRPVSDIAVDRSNDRIAYVAFNGFNAATPHSPGHVFMTTDGGNNWKDISSNLPDAPVNSLQIDASYPDTIYAGTDVGPFVTYNGGTSWQPLGTGFPTVEIWQFNLDPSNRNLRAGTHGRGAWSMHDGATVPALVVSKIDNEVPVGPGSQIDYTITVHNVGNADATGVSIVDPIPNLTTFASADNGGTLGSGNKGKVTWSGLTVTAGNSVEVHLSVTIDSKLHKKDLEIVNDGLTVTSAQGVGTTGSAHITPIAPPFAVSVSPASQTDGAAVGGSVTYSLHVSNGSFQADTYSLAAASGSFPAVILNAACASPVSSVTLAGGATADICVEVDVPDGTANAATDTTTVTATSTGDPSISASATVTTIAVAATVDTLLVDNDGNGPDVQSYYTAALTAAGRTFDVWDLATSPVLPLGYMKAHPNIVWFTGNSYPDPVGVYEANLGAYLNGGGRLFMSGQDILDQGAGTTSFVHDYLHVNWDGSETQNDISTATVAGEDGNPVTDGIGTVNLDLSVLLGAEFSDELTLVDPAAVAFRDDSGNPDGLSVAVGSYKVAFLAFPFEEFGTAADKGDLMTRVYTWFAAP